MEHPQASLFSCNVCAYFSCFSDINFQRSPRISISRILVLPLKIRFVHGFWQFRGFYIKDALFRSVCCIMMTLHYRRAAARCNNKSFVASEPWFLGTCRRRYRPEILPALVSIMSTALRAITLGLILALVPAPTQAHALCHSLLALQPSKMQGKGQPKNYLFRDEHCRNQDCK
jgi:hypothetical protein